MTLQPDQNDVPDPNDFLENPLHLRCVEVVELVTHYIDGGLDSSDHEKVDGHLLGCENCVVFVSQIRMTVQLSAATKDHGLSASPANIAELSALIARRAGHRQA